MNHYFVNHSKENSYQLSRLNFAMKTWWKQPQFTIPYFLLSKNQFFLFGKINNCGCVLSTSIMAVPLIPKQYLNTFFKIPIELDELNMLVKVILLIDWENFKLWSFEFGSFAVSLMQTYYKFIISCISFVVLNKLQLIVLWPIAFDGVFRLW